MAQEEPVNGELYWTPSWFYASEIGAVPTKTCFIEENAIILLLCVAKHKNYMELRFLCGTKACQLLLNKETYLERFNVLFKPVSSLPNID